MSGIDWGILIASLAFIVVYGVWKSRGVQTTESFLRGSQKVPWYTIGLSIMATQASAITFLSAPGQAFEDGMRFVQFYLGLPLAMIVLCVTFVPIFHKLKCYTAYEFLEQRFDTRMRSFSALIFLFQRGLSTSLTIYAPSLVLSAMLGWPTVVTNSIMGGLVIIYTVSGGTKAVSYTQKQQMIIILSSMAIAFAVLIHMLPQYVSVVKSLEMAGKLGKMNVIDLSFNPESKYNIWTGLIGGFFLALSYFGTDHSQVSRYLTGTSIAESRLGLLMNGFVKIPMQFFILLIGVVLYVFYIYHTPPPIFNPVEAAKLEQSAYAAEYKQLTAQWAQEHENRKISADLYIQQPGQAQNLQAFQMADAAVQEVKQNIRQLMLRNDANANDKDTNYIFLSFVTQYLPSGLIGLLIAVIFAASMGSTASALNSLTAVTILDVYKRSIAPRAGDRHYVIAARIITVFWGLFAIFFAEMAGKLGSLIEVVNILGSLFYGVILGIFLVAFYVKYIQGKAAFIAAIVTQLCMLYFYWFTTIPFLWYNVIGCIMVITLGAALQYTLPAQKE
jgi:SSS family transporter